MRTAPLKDAFLWRRVERIALIIDGQLTHDEAAAFKLSVQLTDLQRSQAFVVSTAPEYVMHVFEMTYQKSRKKSSSFLYSKLDHSFAEPFAKLCVLRVVTFIYWVKLSVCQRS